MTATLVTTKGGSRFAHHPLFEGLDVIVAPGGVIGVVGANRPAAISSRSTVWSAW